MTLKLNFNAVSEVSFTASLNNSANSNYYNQLKCGKVLFLDQYGYFIITKCDISDDGVIEQKSVSALSAEYELIYSRLTYLEGTIKLYNPLNAKDETTILGKFLKSNPLWKIGNIDNEFWDIYRTYDESSTNWYNFLVQKIEETHRCIVKFDNINRILSIYSPEKITKKTNIYISHKNLIKSLAIEEKSEEVFTALNCYGGGELDIARVNPMGTNIIYDFEYFKTSEWMDESTILAITNWEKKFVSQKNNYKQILTSLRNKHSVLVAKKVELTEFEESLKKIEVLIAVKISQGITNDSSYINLVNQKNQTKSNIIIKKNEITSVENEIANIKKSAETINKSLSFPNNFTAEQIKTLNSITYMDDYQNESFIKTDIMNEVEIQDQSQALFDHCLKILDRVSFPRYYFSADLVNFVFLKDFEKFTKQLELGCMIKVGIKKGWKADVVLLSMTLNFDDPTNFPVEFSNRYRLDNGAFEFEDIYSDNSRSSTKVNWDSLIWNNQFESKEFSQVRDFISGNFDAAKNALESAQGIGVSFDGSGLHLRKYTDGVLQPYETWMIDNMIAMSDDNFNTSPKIAIGRFKLPNSQNFGYGINAEFIAGYLVCGDNFVFENRDKNSKVTQFRFDANGAYLYNSSITIENDFSQIKLSPNDASAFTISGRPNRQANWVPKIFMDTKGNANFVGKITAEEGLIAGWQIKNNGLFSPFGDYIRNDGYAKLSLLTLTPYSGTFDGNVYAKNLKAGRGQGTNGSDAGYINNGHLASNTIDGDKMSNNSISGTKLMASYKDSVTNAIASVEVKADKNSASITSLTTYTNNEFGKVNKSIASVTQTANNNSASINLHAQYISQNRNSIASVTQTANNNSASINMHAQYISQNARNIASIELYADELGSEIRLNANRISTNASEINAANSNIRALGLDVKSLKSDVATINKLYVTSAEVNTIVVNKGYITRATCDSIIANKGYINEATCRSIAASYAKIDWGSINQASIAVLRSGSCSCSSLTINGKMVYQDSININGKLRNVWSY